MADNFENAINTAIDDTIENLFGETDKTEAKMVEQGVRHALTENPFNTTSGQIVTSASETFHARQIREGNRKVVSYNASAIPGTGTNAFRDFGKPDAGYLYFPRFIQFRPTVESVCILKIKTGIAGASAIILLNRKVAANENIEVNLAEMGILGEYVQVGADYGVELQISSTGSAGTFDGCSYGVQVAVNG